MVIYFICTFQYTDLKLFLFFRSLISLSPIYFTILVLGTTEVGGLMSMIFHDSLLFGGPTGPIEIIFMYTTLITF